MDVLGVRVCVWVLLYGCRLHVCVWLFMYIYVCLCISMCIVKACDAGIGAIFLSIARGKVGLHTHTHTHTQNTLKHIRTHIYAHTWICIHFSCTYTAVSCFWTQHKHFHIHTHILSYFHIQMPTHVKHIHAHLCTDNIFSGQHFCGVCMYMWLYVCVFG